VPAKLRQLREEFRRCSFAANEADAAATAAHAAKDKAQRELVEAMKTDFQYADAVSRSAPEKLLFLGWKPKRTRHDRVGRAHGPPGQVHNLRISSRGWDSIELEWDAPAKGGYPAAYQIQRRRWDAESEWENIDSATETKHLLKSQPQGVELAFQVYALNKSGAGTPSNVVTAKI
jgi:hypothetical protein